MVIRDVLSQLPLASCRMFPALKRCFYSGCELPKCENSFNKFTSLVESSFSKWLTIVSICYGFPIGMATVHTNRHKCWAITAATIHQNRTTHLFSQILWLNFRLFSLPLQSNLLKILFCQWVITAQHCASYRNTRLLSQCTSLQSACTNFQWMLWESTSELVKMVMLTGFLFKNVIKHDFIFHSNSAENHFPTTWPLRDDSSSYWCALSIGW